MANIVLDDKTNLLKIGGGTWSAVSISRFFGGGAIWPAFAADDNGDTGTYGTLSMSFEGLSSSVVDDVELMKNDRDFYRIFW